jgi:hypothetical protein
LIKPVDRDRLAVLIEKHRIARSSTAEAKVPSRPAATREEQRPIEVEVSRRT